MGYDLKAFVAKQGILDEIHQNYPETALVPLYQNLSMLLNSYHFAFGFPDAKPAPEITLSFARLNTAIIDMFTLLSQKGRIAYIEINCFGGLCEQYAIVWEKSSVIFGPEYIDGGIGPVNRALKLLGVETKENYDEFTAIGFDRHRHIENWYEEATGKSYAPEDDVIGGSSSISD